jgi:hypothetical protein
MTTNANAELLAQLEALKAENAKLKEANNAKISVKLGQGGTVCLYHGGRFPVALYASQWERILPYLKAGHVERFIAENADKVARKS